MSRVHASLVVVTMVSAIAEASPAAEKLFQDGRKLLKAGKLAEACDAFWRSNELERRAGTLLNLADCEERRGRVATAWEAFVAARALAVQSGDRIKQSEAERRASALTARLPYLTMRAPARPPAGFAVKRNGKEVTLAVLDREVPIDPGDYEIEASAPGHVIWKQALTVAIGQRAVIDIPALEPAPNAQPPQVAAATTTTAATSTPPPAVAVSAAAPPPAAPRGRRVGFGVAAGVSTDGAEPMFGGRIALHLAHVGAGTIRAVPTVFYYERKNIGDDPYHDAEHFALGLGAEYVAPLGRMFAVAAGLGVGLDLIDDTYDERTQKDGWGAARLSPTLRIGRSLDIGLHIQVVFDGELAGVAQLGIDYFVW